MSTLATLTTAGTPTATGAATSTAAGRKPGANPALASFAGLLQAATSGEDALRPVEPSSTDAGLPQGSGDGTPAPGTTGPSASSDPSTPGDATAAAAATADGMATLAWLPALMDQRGPTAPQPAAAAAKGTAAMQPNIGAITASRAEERLPCAQAQPGSGAGPTAADPTQAAPAAASRINVQAQGHAAADAKAAIALAAGATAKPEDSAPTPPALAALPEFAPARPQRTESIASAAPDAAAASQGRPWTPAPESAGTVSATPSADQPQAPPPAESMTYWSTNGIHTGELRLNDETLAGVDIRVRMDGHEAQVDFASDQGATRDWLEHSAARLQDLLGESGIQLTQLNVGTSASHERPPSQPGQAARAARVRAAAASEPGAPVRAPAAGRGAIDLFV